MKPGNNMTIRINSESDNAEFTGQIIDIFENFLEERGIVIYNTEREDAIDRGDVDVDAAAIIYGSDYGKLKFEIESLLHNWSRRESVWQRLINKFIRR